MVSLRSSIAGFAAVLALTGVPSLAHARTGNVVAAYRLEGDVLKRAVQPGPNAIEAGKHYANLAIEEVRIHGASFPRPLALVLKVAGALPQGGEFTAVLGVAKKPEDDGYYKFTRPVIINPFVYKGQPLVVEVALAPCTEAWAEKIKEAKKEWGEVRHVDPNDYKVHPVDSTHLGTDGSDWFKASFATLNDPSSLILEAGRYVVFSHPNPQELLDKVTFDERGMIWKGKDEPVKGVSFVTILINRRKRGPRRDGTSLEAGKRAVDAAIVGGRTDDAKSAIEKLPELIKRDPHITDLERELETAWIKIYQLRMERRAAREQKDKATFTSKCDELVAALNEIRKKFGDLLEPYEVNKMKYSIRRYLREGQDPPF
jgi:hypothetical protein